MEFPVKNFSAYILAGGKSSRMGNDKALLTFNRMTFLEHAFLTLETTTSTPVVVVVKDQNRANVIHEVLPTTQCIFDLYTNKGVLAGIHAALTDSETEFAIILACDMPFVTDNVIKKLCETANSTDADCIVPKTNDGKLQPLCAVYRVSSCLPVLEGLLKKKKTSYSANQFLTSIRAFIVEQTEFDSSTDVFLNVNRLEDYESILKL